MSILDTFYILFESDSSKLDKGLKESEKKADCLKDKLNDVDKASAKAGAALFELVGKTAGILGLGLSLGAFVAGVKEVAAEHDALAKLASRLRDSAEAVDEFRDASELLGIEQEKSTQALVAMDTAIQDTFLGMGRAKKVFEELGIQVTDSTGKIKPTTAVMGELADKLKGMERGTQIRVMERLGLDPAMLKLFNSDFAELQKRMADIDRATGASLDVALKRSGEYTKASKAMGVEVNVLKMYIEKMSEEMKIAALPLFTKAMEKATEYTKMFSDFLLKHGRLVEGVFIAIGGAISYFLIPAAIKGAISVWAMVAPFAMIGLTAIAIGAAFALLYDDIMTFIDGGDSLIGWAINKWPVLGEIIYGIRDAFKAVWKTGIDVFDFFVKMWDDPAAAFKKFLDLVIDGAKRMISAIPGLDFILGLSNPDGMNEAKSSLSNASNSGLASQTSNSIINSRQVSKQTSVTVGKVEVKTAATDAEGISKTIGNSIQAQMMQAASNYDDGVLA